MWHFVISQIAPLLPQFVIIKIGMILGQGGFNCFIFFLFNVIPARHCEAAFSVAEAIPEYGCRELVHHFAIVGVFTNNPFV